MNRLGNIVIQKILLKLLKIGDKRLLSLLQCAKNLTSHAGVQLLAKIFLTDKSHPFFRVMERFITETNPVCRGKILKNLFLKLGNNPKNISPPTIFISLTSRCNLRCTGCSAHKEMPYDLDITLIDWIISDSKNKGTKLFVLAGGEPFLRKDVLPLLEKHNDAYFQIFTNGTLIDETIAQFFSKVGNALVLFSLEGRAEDTDLRRGEDVFQRITHAMSLLKDKRVLFGVSVLVTPRNFEIVTSQDFVNEMISRGAFFVWYLAYKPVGDKPDMSMLLLPDQRHQLSQRVIEIRNMLPIIAIDHENDISPIGGCLATSRFGIHINAKGGIEPCGILHYSDTSVKKGEPIEASIKKSIILQEIRSLYTSSTSCPMIDRPVELLQIIKRVFPESYNTFTDFKYLEEYAVLYKDGQEFVFPALTKDLYAHLSEYLLRKAFSIN
jgi:MoaA/NifB/PqqE/SkfB family radical SAM enzyme